MNRADPHQNQADLVRGLKAQPEAPALPQAGDVVAGGEKSFQASIRTLNQGRDVAKVYDHNLNLYELVDYRDPSVRKEVMERELLCVGTLSPNLNPRIETVVGPDGTLREALVMRRLEPSDFLDDRIRRGTEIGAARMEQLAGLIAGFHFNGEVCPAAGTSLPRFFEDLLASERKLLLERCADNAAAREMVVGWFDTVKGFVESNRDRFLAAGAQLQEPIRGHGDMKSANIAFTERGEAFVLDVAPYPLWQVNTRRMDAAFLFAELRLLGLEKDAQTFWSAYGERYKEQQAARGQDYSKDPLLTDAVAKMDAFAEFYRYIIFYRLTFCGVDPERAPACEGLLDDVTARIRQMSN